MPSNSSASSHFEWNAISSGTPPFDIDGGRSSILTGAVTTGKIIGMGGGSMRDALACDAPDHRIVGLQIEMSDGPANGQSSRSARGIAIGCATVTVDTLGAHDGSVTMKKAEGDGGSHWSPSTWQPYTPCVAGAVVAGISVHGGAQANEPNLMSDVIMSCASLDVTGATTTVTNLPVAGTMPGTGMNPSSYQCPAGQQIAEIVPFTSAGLACSRAAPRSRATKALRNLSDRVGDLCVSRARWLPMSPGGIVIRHAALR